MEKRPQKRQHIDDRSRSSTGPPAKKTKKTKTRSEVELEAWASWTYPPEFWDRLSEISLTRKAVEEHNRRSRLQNHRSSPRSELRERAEYLAGTFPVRDLARFARHGGPDLSDLRSHPIIHRQSFVAMDSSRSPRSGASMSIDPASTLPTSATTKTTKTKKSTPYNRDFDLHLTDHKIHPVYSSQRPDLTGVRQALTVARPSLSPSQFSEGAFETYQEANARAKDENDVLANVMPAILGPQNSHAVARNTVFGNLEPLTDGTIAAPAPDIYYGAHPEKIARPVRDELAHHIMPSTMQDKPWAPNFFVEVKGPDGSAAVATRQSRYDGAAGTRAMHSLQNYREEELQYDGGAHTFSSTYHGGTGTLQLYAHHVTAPTDEEDRPEYHMTQIRTFGMTDTRETFLQGATVFRNARDLAKKHRDGFIQAANAKASRPKTSTSQDIAGLLEERSPTINLSEWQDGDEELQQSIAGASGYDYGDDGEATAIPQYLSIEADSENPSVALRDAPPLNFASSFTSSFSSAKHPRQSASPPSHSKGSRSSKSQKRPRKRHIATRPGLSDTWEDTY